ncbi:CPBP family intramembrane glutamic endopeptidase [Lentilactobacillus raoultii]|uniref:CPBP family intramembrane glutamic endopeptidase n=1 Tax=Lentilactobacillus raoultii TaxID=1987503 RepID=A0ABW3PQD0_9LACO|nr:CPBP family intramembrane glutamic endopeptidase [Lentilactobacillus raoultii]
MKSQGQKASTANYWWAIVSYIMISLPAMFFEKVSNVTKSSLFPYIVTILEIVMLLIVGRLLIGEMKSELKLFSKKIPVYSLYILLGIVSIIAWNIICNIVYYHPNVNARKFTTTANSAPLIMFIFGAILAPFLEELVFRKALIAAFKSVFNSTILSILLSSLLFGLAHWDWAETALTSKAELMGLLLRFGMGVILSILYLKAKNIFVPIGIHMAINLIAGV